MNITTEKFKVFQGIGENIDGQMSDWLQDRANVIIPVELKYEADAENSTAIVSFVEDRDKVQALKYNGFDVTTQEFVEIYASYNDDNVNEDPVKLKDLFERKLNDWRKENVEKYILRMEFSMKKDFMGALIMFMDAPNKDKVLNQSKKLH